MTGKRLDFPLPERALPRIRVSRAQHEELRAYALHVAQEVIRNGPTWARTNVNAARDLGWKISSRSPDACFMMKTTTAPSSTPAPVSVGPPRRRSSSSGSSSSGGSRTKPRSAHSLDSRSGGSSAHSSGGNISNNTTGNGAGGRGFMGFVRLQGFHLDDVIANLHCDNTHDQRLQLIRSYGPSYLDSCVLQTLESAKPYDPFWYLGIKWAALRSPAERLVNHRDFAYLEHTGSYVNAQGKRLLYRVLQSLSLRPYGGEDAYFGLTRGHLEAAYVYWMDRPGPSLDAATRLRGPGHDSDGTLTICMKGLVHPKGKVPLWLIERYVKRFWKAGWTLHPADALAGPVAQSMTLDVAQEWVADADRAACYLCHKKFRFGRRRRHHCRACGEVMCRDCTEYYALAVTGVLANTGNPPEPVGLHRNVSNTSSNRSWDERESLPRVTPEYRSRRRGNTVDSWRSRGSSSLEGLDGDDDDDTRHHGEGPGGTMTSQRWRLDSSGSDRGEAFVRAKVCRRCVENKQTSLRRAASTLLASKAAQIAPVRSWLETRGKATTPEVIDEGDEPHAEDVPILADSHYYQGRGGGRTDAFTPDFSASIEPLHDCAGYDTDSHPSEFSIEDLEDFRPFSSRTLASDGGHAPVEPETMDVVDTRLSQSTFSVNFHPSEGQLRVPRLDDSVVSAVTAEPPLHEPSPVPMSSSAIATMATRRSAGANPIDSIHRLRLEDLLSDTDDDGDDIDDIDDIDDTDDQDEGIAHGQPSAATPDREIVRPAVAPYQAWDHYGLPATTRSSIRERHSDKDNVDAYPDLSPISETSSAKSFASFNADGLIDATALDESEQQQQQQQQLPVGAVALDPALAATATEDTVHARLQRIEDEVLRRQLLESSIRVPPATTRRFQEPFVHPKTGPMPSTLPTAVASSHHRESLSGGQFSLSEASTISSNGSFVSSSASLAVDPTSHPPPQRLSNVPSTRSIDERDPAVLQAKVDHGLADQAYLLQCIQRERERVRHATQVPPRASGAAQPAWAEVRDLRMPRDQIPSESQFGW